MAHVHSITDNDKRFIINPDSRTAVSPTRAVVAWMDHNSEYITFKIPRYVESHDMTLCNKVEIHYRNYGDDGERFGIYTINDLHVDPSDENTLVFTWLISQNATSIVGRLIFVIRFQCLDNTKILYAWSTIVHDAITVSESLRNTETIVEQYADVLEQWKIELENQKIPPELVDEAIRDYLTENPIDVGNAVTYTPQTLTEEQKAQVRANIGIEESGVDFETGNALELVDGVLNVKTTDNAEADNTLPITSSGVNAIVGNIGAILDTI